MLYIMVKRFYGDKMSLNNNINLSDSFTIQLVGFYQTKQNLNNGGVMEPMGKLDLSIQKKIDENFILTLNGTNLLNTMRFRPFFDIPDLNIIQSADILFLKPQAKITITYNFGNRNVKSKKIESTEESQRIKTGAD